MKQLRTALATFIAAAVLLVSALPAAADTVSITYYQGACGGYTYGHGTTFEWSSDITAITVRDGDGGGGPPCTYRAVQLNWWNGSSYVTTSWDEQYSQNAAIGVGVGTYGYSSHRLGQSGFSYALETSYSWL
jgi:hypothetical protein